MLALDFSTAKLLVKLAYYRAREGPIVVVKALMLVVLATIHRGLEGPYVVLLPLAITTLWGPGGPHNSGKCWC